MSVRYAELVYFGRMVPYAARGNAGIYRAYAETVTGWAKLKLYKGQCDDNRPFQPPSLYREDFGMRPGRCPRPI